MRDWEYDVVAYEGDYYCVDCLPEGVGPEDEGCDPVFGQSEVDFYPVCCECAAVHDYMNKLNADTEEREDADA